MADMSEEEIEILRSQFVHGWIDRREFLACAIGLGLSVSAASALATRSALAADSATPKPGGRFRVGIANGATADTLDPATFASLHQVNIGYAIRNNLTEIDSSDTLAPELAESYEVSDDASRWTFKIRKGVEFHNGKTLDAGDVVATLNYHRGDSTKSAAKALLETIEDAKSDGKHTVIVQLAAGSADFPYVLTDYHLGIMPADSEGNALPDDGIGTGGYSMETFEPGVRANLNRFPNYWKEGRAHFDSAELLVIADPSARANALVTGELDAFDECDLKTVHLLARNPEIAIDETASGAHTVMPMHTDVAPFDNNDVRLALKYALDRESLLQTVVQGHGTLGNDHPIGPVLPFYAELPQRSYDPDKAKFHLKKSGIDSLKVQLSAADTAWPGAVDAATLFREHAAKARIEIDVVREPNDGYWSNVWLKKPFVVSLWGARPTPDVIFSLGYAKDAAWNESHLDHARFNALLVEARAELDDSRRQEMYAEMQVIVRDEGGTIVPFFRNHVYARSVNVQREPSIASNWQLDGNKAVERWWFA